MNTESIPASSKISRPVCVLFSSSQPTTTGGGQKSLLLLLKNLDRTKFQPLLMVPDRGDLMKEAERLGIPCLAFALRSLGRFDFGMVFKLRRLLKMHKVAIVHTDAPRQTVYLGCAGLLARVPVVWHVRVSTPEPAVYERFLYSLSTRIIAVSAAAARRFLRFRKKSSSEKVRVIFNAVDTGIPESTQPNKPSCIHPPVVGMAGRIEQVKGIGEIVKAAGQVVEKYPDIQFLIAGEGKEQYVAKLNVEITALFPRGNVQLTGYQNDMRNFLGRLSIFVNVSKIEGRSGGEGLPRGVIEAMSLGRPVIASDTGGNPEAVQDGKTGIIIPQGDSNALACAIMKLLNEPALMDEMGEKGKETVLDKFTIDKQVRAIEDLYLQLLYRNKVS